MTASMHRVLAALNLPTRVPKLIVRARAIVTAMAKSSWFPKPVPSLATVGAAIDRLEKKEVAALAMTKGLKQARNEARDRLVKLLQRLKAYVQGVADDNPASAASIIASAGMDIAGQTRRPKAPLDVFRGLVSGSVRLIVKAVAKEATYYWQVRRDGVSGWTDLPKTLQAKTTVEGLEPGAAYRFRFRAVTRRMTTVWSDPVAYVVQ